jgi:hypothetical protein
MTVLASVFVLLTLSTFAESQAERDERMTWWREVRFYLYQDQPFPAPLTP